MPILDTFYYGIQSMSSFELLTTWFPRDLSTLILAYTRPNLFLCDVSSDETGSTLHLHRLDVDTLTWSRGGMQCIPHADIAVCGRYMYTRTMIDGHVYIYDLILRYNLDLNPLNNIVYCAIEVINDELWLCGTNDSIVVLFTLVNNTWVVRSRLNVCIYEFTVCHVGTYIYILDEWTSTPERRIYQYNMITGEWLWIGLYDHHAKSYTLLPYKNELLVIERVSGSTRVYRLETQPDIGLFNLNTMTMSSKGGFAVGQSQCDSVDTNLLDHCDACVFEDTIYVVSVDGSCRRYDPASGLTKVIPDIQVDSTKLQWTLF